MPTLIRAYPGPPPGVELGPSSYLAPKGLVDGDPREHGVTETFGEGDSFVVAAGWSGVYRVDKPFLKHFALAVPTA